MKLGIREKLKERTTSGFKSLGRFRLNVSHAAILSFAALILILFIAFTIRVLPLRWEIPGGTVRLNEFDPYYQFILTRRMVQYGLLSPYYPTPWIEMQSWYPQGLDMSRSLPGLPMTAAVLYDVVTFVGGNVDLMTFVSFIPAIMGAFSCLILYYVGKDMGGKAVGLIAALFLALSPSYLQRTALGFFDTEVPGIFALLLFMLLFLRSIEGNRSLRSSLMYTVGSGLALAYFILGWGAAYFLTGLVSLFVFVLILLKRYSPRILISYSLTFGIALFVATKFPNISLGYLTSGPVLPLAAVFLLLCLAEVLRNNISLRTKLIMTVAATAAIVGGFIAIWQLGYVEGIAGKFVTILDPFIRAANPLIESVAEHRVSAWGNIYFELGIGILFFLVGLYFTMRNPTNRNIFMLLFGLTSLYFAASMVRILAVFAPAFALLAATGVTGVLKPFYTLLREVPQIAAKTKRGIARVSKEYSAVAIFLVFILLVTNLAFSPQSSGVPRVYGQAYNPLTVTASSLPIAPNEPIPEWTNMLTYTQNNLQSTDVVASWWDYGYWLTILGNVTTLADNATINATQIENVGFMMMANETDSLKMLAQYNAKYILVFTTLVMSQASQQQTIVAQFGRWGDEGKWTWMAKISGQAQKRLVDAGFVDENSSWTDETKFGSVSNQTNQWVWNAQGKASVIYKLMTWAKQQYANSFAGYVTSDETATQPDYFKDVYIAGVGTSPSQYGGIIPLVALYQIDWQKYYNATGTTG